MCQPAPIAYRVVARFCRIASAYRVADRATRIALDFGTPEAMKAYLREHPKADKTKHRVVEVRKPTAKPQFDDQDEVVAGLNYHWKGKGTSGDVVDHVIQALKSRRPVGSNVLELAIAAAKGKSSIVEDTLADLLEELQSKPPRKPEVEAPAPPNPNSEAQPSPKAKPETKPTDKPPAHPKATGKGVGKGVQLEVEVSTELKSQLDQAVSKLSIKPTKEGKPSHVEVALKAAGHPADEIKKIADWSTSWVSGVPETKKSNITVTSAAVANKFVKDLATPGSWAQAKYAATQAIIKRLLPELQKEGVVDADGYVTLYRGINGKQAKEARSSALTGGKEVDGTTVKVGIRSLSSWTDKIEVTNDFIDTNHMVLEQKVHISRVASMWKAEGELYQANKEREWAVIAPEDGAVTATVHFRKQQH